MDTTGRARAAVPRAQRSQVFAHAGEPAYEHKRRRQAKDHGEEARRHGPFVVPADPMSVAAQCRSEQNAGAFGIRELTRAIKAALA